jgi:AraC family transcriptional regulator, regulatory protein of adaptative response / DNA-3-methyladenine glycosylase II
MDGPIRLRYGAPFAAEPLFRFLGERAVAGVEAFDGITYHRSLRQPDGSATVIGLTAGDSSVALNASGDASAREAAERVARRILDLDAEPATIDAALSTDPVLAPLVAARPGIRVPGVADGFELAVRAVLGQQVSVRAARTFAGRIVQAMGPSIPYDRRTGDVTRLFPSAADLADGPVDRIGLTTSRAATLRRLAGAVASGEVDLTGVGDPATTVQGLRSIPGIGPWTAAYVAMRALGDTDAFPATDLGVRVGFERLGLPSTQVAIRTHAERWRPWRAYAVMHLWSMEAGRPAATVGSL